MKLLLIRHAAAEDRDDFAKSGKPDSERPLTEKGKAKFLAAARGLVRIRPGFGAVISSPLIRALQTREILLRGAAGRGRMDSSEKSRGGRSRAEESLVWSEIEPEAPIEPLASKILRSRQASLTLVGHEPQLSRLLIHLLTDGAPPSERIWLSDNGRPFRFKKGGAALLTLERFWTLEWFLAPRVLRELAGQPTVGRKSSSR